MKKGDLSIQVIVVAAIALIVLVVLVLIFTGKLAIFGSATKDCTTYGGVCAPECGSEMYNTINYPFPAPQAKCSVETDKCCVKGAS